MPPYRITKLLRPPSRVSWAAGLAKVGLPRVSLRLTYSCLLAGTTETRHVRVPVDMLSAFLFLIASPNLDWEQNSLPFMGQR